MVRLEARQIIVKDRDLVALPIEGKCTIQKLIECELYQESL